MTPTLTNRIARIASPNVVELALRRNAKFGRLNVARIDAYVSHAEDRAAACTCERVKGFEIDTRRHNGPLDAQFTLARFRRMAAQEAAA